jgi:hypothetical protein
MNTGHTPGPWHVSLPTFSLHAIRDAKGRIVADVGFCETLERNDANAKFIAAAPATATERDKLKALNAELVAALQLMWDSSCTNAASRPSKAAFLAARAALENHKGATT